MKYVNLFLLAALMVGSITNAMEVPATEGVKQAEDINIQKDEENFVSVYLDNEYPSAVDFEYAPYFGSSRESRVITIPPKSSIVGNVEYKKDVMFTVYQNPSTKKWDTIYMSPRPTFKVNGKKPAQVLKQYTPSGNTKKVGLTASINHNYSKQELALDKGFYYEKDDLTNRDDL